MEQKNEKRLFAGVAIPADIRKQIETIQNGISGARWYPPENLHLTLSFLGNVKDEKLPIIHYNLRIIQFELFQLRITGVGFWEPNILWLGATINDELKKLKMVVEKSLIPCGYIPDHREFIPHITIARLKGGFSRDDLRDFLAKHKNFKSDKFKVDSFHLYESKPAANGSVYEILESYPFQKRE